MIDRLKFPVVIACGLAFSWWVGTGTFNYFTYSNAPIISLKGLEHHGSYARQVECFVSSDNEYKVATVNVMVDGKPFVTKRVKAKKFQVPFVIDTSTLADGQHTLELEAIDSSYNRNKTDITYNFAVDNSPLHAAFVSSAYIVDQGKTLHLKIQANKK